MDKLAASITLAVISVSMSALPASPATGIAGLVPRPATMRCGTNQLPIDKGLNIILDSAATATTRYAAECLRAELARLFRLDAAILQDQDKARAEEASVFLDDTGGGLLANRFPRLRELPPPGDDGYRIGVFPHEKTVVVQGHGRSGVIRGAYALASLAAGDNRSCTWPEALISDTPELRMRFTRGILSGTGASRGMTEKESRTTELDWWARWGLNYALLPLNGPRGAPEEQMDEWMVQAAHQRGMKVGVSLGGRSLCASDGAQMDAYLTKVRQLLVLGCDFFLILYDDLPRQRLGGHCERCIRKFGGSLATEQRFILESVSDVLAEAGRDRQLIWCPIYYSLGMTGYLRGAEGPDAYFSILGSSARVRQAWMFHCAFDREFNTYLEGKGLTHRVWWYNGIRTDYYMVSREFDGYEGWGPRLRIPGLKDFQSFFPPFENGWLMPGYASAKPALHRCLAPTAEAARDEQCRTVIPRASWQELGHIADSMEGMYYCGASSPYHIALAGVFSAHPGLFDQRHAETAILDAMFSRGGARQAMRWEKAYAQAQMILAHAQGTPLANAAAANIRELVAQMETAERALKDCAAEGRPALPRPMVARLLADMSTWRAKVRSLAGAGERPQAR